MTDDRANWAGSYSFRAERIVAARDAAEVQALVRETVAHGGRMRALGTRHSFTDLADTRGTLVTLVGADPRFELDAAAGTVSVGAGVRYGVLALWLEERGWALRNMGSLPHISVGGATATGTHGSGDGNPILTDAVEALQYVGADGELRTVRRGDDDFAALAVGLGAFGIVTRLTLRLRPTFRMRQDVYRGLAWDALLAGFDDITAAGYSTSVFTRWDADEPSLVWVKRELATDEDPVPDVLEGAVRDGSSRGAILDDIGDNVTEQGGVPGPWLLRLPHFRLDATPSNGDELQTEYFVPRADAVAALEAVRALGERIRPHLIVTELRTVARDGLWLSGAYERDALGIHFTWRNEPAGVRGVLPAIEEALAPFGARPHWGKLHLFDAERIAAVHPRLADARAVFERLDPDAVFSAPHLERLGIRLPAR
jgi:alditol oxidase